MAAIDRIAGLSWPLMVAGFLLPALNANGETEIEVTARLEHIENPQRRMNSISEDLLSQVTFGANYTQETQFFNSTLDYRANKLEYKNDSLQDRNLVSGNGNIIWKIKPDIFSWNLANSRTFQAIDTAQPDTTDNRQIVDITSTGPSLSMRLGPTNIMDINLDYSVAEYQQIGTFSQDRKAANIALTHLFSPALSGSIKANTLDADFDVGDAFDFKRDSVSVQGTLARDRYGLTVELGRNEVQRQLVGNWSSLLVRVDANLNINTNSSISAAYSRSGEDLLSNIQLLPGQTSGLLGDRIANSNQSQVFELKRTSLSYSYTTPSMIEASIAYTHLNREFQVINNIQEDENLSLQLTWPLTQNLIMTLFGRRSDLTFSEGNRDQGRNEVGIQGSYRLSEGFSIQFSTMHTRQNANILLDNYEGLNSFISVSYRH